MASSNVLTSTELIGQQIQGIHKFSDIIESKLNGKLYLIPFRHSKVLTFHPSTHQIQELIGNVSLIDERSNNEKWKWYRGTYVDQNQTIYCAPAMSNDVLIIDTKNDVVNLLNLPEELHNGNTGKYSSCAYCDNTQCVYFFPEAGRNIIKLHISTHEITILHNVNCGRNWKHAVSSSKNGKIYAISGYNAILEFNPLVESFRIQEFTVEKQLELPPYLDTVNYYDIVEHNDGHLYGVPFNASQIIRINTETLQVSMLGDELDSEQWGKFSKTLIGNDDCIYGIPHNAPYVLRFDPSTHTTTKLHNPESYPKRKCIYQWESACLANDGNMYCVPNAATQILKITNSRWNHVRMHVLLRLLVERGRASFVNTSSTTIRNESNCFGCWYRNWIQNSSDDVFARVLQYL